VILPSNNFCSKRHFIGGETQCFFCNIRGNTFHFVNNSSRFYHRYPKFRITLTRSHTCFRWFSCNWFIRKNSYPDFTTTLNKTSNSNSTGFNLS